MHKNTQVQWVVINFLKEFANKLGLDIVAETSQEDWAFFLEQDFLYYPNCKLSPKWAGIKFLVWWFDLKEFHLNHTEQRDRIYWDEAEKVKPKLEELITEYRSQ